LVSLQFPEATVLLEEFVDELLVVFVLEVVDVVLEFELEVVLEIVVEEEVQDPVPTQAQFAKIS
jgi:hypothetical protein